MSKVPNPNLIDRLIELLIEIVNPELREIAENNVARPIWNGRNPAVKCLLIVEAVILVRALHFQQHTRLPKEVYELLAL